MGVISRKRRFATWLVAALVAGSGFGCSLEEQSAPALSGPSEFGLSVTATATPNQLPRDGSSQSTVTLTVRDAQGRAVSGQRLVLAVTPTSAAISATEVVTDANGRATFTVTAPPSSALAGAAVTVTATPVGDAAAGEFARTFTISLTGNVNTTLPTPSFTVTPESPEVNQLTTLDASGTTDEGATCLDVCTYSWDLGGEATRTGRIVTYRFQKAQIYNVALTVTDRSGAQATTRTNVTVTEADRPTISFNVEPTSPTAGQLATFTATTTVADNHRIASIVWNWGDGTASTTTTNAAATHTFKTAGTYIVTATITDDLGQAASSTESVTVGSGVTASFTISPTNPRFGDTVIFNGAASTASGGATIIEWVWDFGDGEDPEIHTSARANKVYAALAAARTYVVRLTVRDSNGNTGTTTSNLTVSP